MELLFNLSVIFLIAATALYFVSISMYFAIKAFNEIESLFKK